MHIVSEATSRPEFRTPEASLGVLLVEDDPSLRAALARILSQAGFEVSPFDNAEAMLAHVNRGSGVAPEKFCCLVLDLRLGGLSGVQAQQQLRLAGLEIPIVFISGEADTRSVNQAWRDGASDFLLKPFSARDIVGAVHAAIHRPEQTPGSQPPQPGSSASSPSELAAHGQLTRREREVMALISNGLKNTEIAEAMKISLRTVKMHRSNLMHKLGFTHVAELVRFHDRIYDAA